MLGYTVRRVLVALGLIYIVGTLIFLLLHVVPGDPAELLLSGGGVAPPEESVVALRQKLGLDQPLVVQYFTYLERLFAGDLGNSFQDEMPVIQDIAQRLPRTLELIAAATLISA